MVKIIHQEDKDYVESKLREIADNIIHTNNPPDWLVNSITYMINKYEKTGSIKYTDIDKYICLSEHYRKKK